MQALVIDPEIRSNVGGGRARLPQVTFTHTY